MEVFSLPQALLGIFFAAFLSFVSLKMRFLTSGGAVAAASTGSLVFGLGGWRWAVPLLMFFFTSSILSRLNKTAEAKSVFEKTGQRDAWQVFANGGVAIMLVGCWFFKPYEAFYSAYLGSLAAVTADTWGTEIGFMTGRKTFLVTTFCSVPRGQSGAVSFEGILASILGALCIALTAMRSVPIVIIAGLVGSLVDSFLGATAQAQYRCKICDRVVEQAVHCHSDTVLVRGFGWLTNDWVNVGCATAGAVLAYVLFEFQDYVGKLLDF